MDVEDPLVILLDGPSRGGIVTPVDGRGEVARSMIRVVEAEQRHILERRSGDAVNRQGAESWSDQEVAKNGVIALSATVTSCVNVVTFCVYVLKEMVYVPGFS